MEASCGEREVSGAGSGWTGSLGFGAELAMVLTSQES